MAATADKGSSGHTMAAPWPHLGNNWGTPWPKVGQETCLFLVGRAVCCTTGQTQIRTFRRCRLFLRLHVEPAADCGCSHCQACHESTDWQEEGWVGGGGVGGGGGEVDGVVSMWAENWVVG
jgi:hypothetical protein